MDVAERAAVNAEILATQKMLREQLVPMLLKELERAHIYVQPSEFELYYRPDPDLIMSVRGGNPVRLFIHARPIHHDFVKIIREALKQVARYKTESLFKRRGLSFAFAEALRDAKPESADPNYIPGCIPASEMEIERYSVLRLKHKETGVEVSAMYPTFTSEVATYEKLLIELTEKVMFATKAK